MNRSHAAFTAVGVALLASALPAETVLRVREVAHPLDVLPPGTNDTQLRGSLNDPSLNAHSDVIFQFWDENAQSIASVAPFGDPWTAASANWLPDSALDLVGISDTGSVAIYVRTPQLGQPTEEALLIGPPGGLVEVLTTGQSVSHNADFFTINSIFPVAFTTASAVDICAFTATATRQSDAATRAVFGRIVGGTPQIIAVQGDAAIGGPAGATFALPQMDYPYPVLVNGAGDYVFQTRLMTAAPSTIIDSIWLAGDTGPQTLVVVGTPIPGLAIPAPTFAELLGLNNAGQFLFRVRTAPGSSAPWSHLIVGNIQSGDYEIVAAAGDPVPEMAGSPIGTFDRAVLNSQGEVAFGAGVFQPFPNPSPAFALFFQSGKSRSFVCGPAETPVAPGNELATVGYNSLASLGINRLGQVVFGANLRRNGVAIGPGIVGWDPQRGLTALAARDVPMQTSDASTVTPIAIEMRGLVVQSANLPMNEPSAAGDQDGRRRIIADNGDVVFRALLPGATGDQVIYVATVPAPAFGDANGDDICNGRDLSVLLSSFGNAVSPAGSGADFNADGVVNGADLSIFLAAFGT